MKTTTLCFAIATCCLFAACSKKTESSNQPTDATASENLLDAWSYVLVDEDVKKEDVWSEKDGVIICKGEPLGYLVTKESYQDFKLELDWRWAPGTAPGNSGVLLRIAGEPATFMPKCVEAQLKSGSAGDLWAFFGASMEGEPSRFREIKDHKDLGDFKGIAKIKAAEKAPGEWNHYEITLSGGKINVVVNGEAVNQASGLDVLSGPIGLQSEGGEIHFRNFKVTPQ
ncbi:DUF1080 domain-containing protein [Verrucomicrobiaceae bacterium N1E253]|uniref:DUF1080 domain-containing protein n=1 Tax=Oceaniferula marina TaxID=2748318 RepID=A0A851GP95_9BACT|nr:DUF1080 domain-containing protein [Oceaniferula marina]NWK55964.1 DUF1080 domain-containing protein [Oceaniferula marina]